jgi:NADH:ubiquinone oxidoreductase subunit 5 (subunit L)/multisubunit Na+/H+ antiporter MnhA subunit
VPLIILGTCAVFAGFLNPGFHIFGSKEPPMEHWLSGVFEAAAPGVSLTAGAEALPFELEVGIGGITALVVGAGIAYWMYIARGGAPGKQLAAWYDRVMTRNVVLWGTGVVPLAAGVFVWVAPGRGWMKPFDGSLLVAITLVLFGLVRTIQGSLMGKAEPVAAASTDKKEPKVFRPGMDEVYEAVPLAAVDSLADTMNAIDKYVVDGIIARLTALLVAAFGTILRALQNGVVHLYAAAMVVGLAVMGWFFVWPHANATVAKSASGDYVVTAAPGMGYSYKWDAQCEGKPDSPKYTDKSECKVSLDPTTQTKVVNLEVINAFNLRGTTQVAIAAPKPVEAQNGN